MIRDTVNRAKSPVGVVVAAATLLVLLLPLAACAPGSPEEQVAASRAEYKIELNSWQAKKPVEPAPEVAEEGETAEAAAVAATASEAAAAEEGEEGEEGAGEEIATGPQPTDVLFDLVVYFKGRKPLPGVTVDITHAGAAQEEKAVYHHYIETSGIVSGETRQADFVLEGLEFEEGDVFAVEVVAGVPADLSKYREFSETGS